MRTIYHVVDVPAPAQALWEALTTQEGLSDWWTTRVETGDAHVGSVINFHFQAGFNPEMEVTLLERPYRVHWKCSGGHEPWHDSTFEFEMEQQHQDVRLRFSQHYGVELSDDAYGIYNYNWAYYLQSLYDLVTTGLGKPFQAS